MNYELFKFLYIKVRWGIYVLAYIAAVITPLFYTFRQKILYLPVYRSEIVFCS